MAEPRRTFGPVVLAGLGAGALTAVSSARPWVDVTATGDTARRTLATDAVVETSGEMPLALALGLVLLAAWGVLLVTRRLVRRAVAVLAVASALGVVATVVTGYLRLPDRVREALAESGTAGAWQVERNAWLGAAAVGALGSVACAVLAVRWAGHWPEMGGRYDAPGTTTAPAPDPEDRSSLDLWQALDEGRDPTA